MGYLHKKGIIHKELKTANIFLENKNENQEPRERERGATRTNNKPEYKVLISDFGLLNIIRLCRSHV